MHVSLKIKNIKNKREKLNAFTKNLVEILGTPVAHATNTEFAYANQYSSNSSAGQLKRPAREVDYPQLEYTIDE
jgi:hypothetical protein